MRFIPYSYLSIAKRCKNGYHKNPKTGQCEPKNQKGTSNTSSGCQEGFHQHAGYKNCHEIWKPHKAHTLSCNQHRLLGIPCRYKGEELDANGRPVDKGIPTRQWLKQAKEKKEKEGKGQKKEMEEETSVPEMHPFISTTNERVNEICSSLDGYQDMVNSVLDKLKSDNISDDDYIEHIKEAFKDVPWINAPNFNSESWLSRVKGKNGVYDFHKYAESSLNYIIKNCMSDIAKTIEKFPLGLLGFTQLCDNYIGGMVEGIMATHLSSGQIFLGWPLFSLALTEFNVLKGDVNEKNKRDGEYRIKRDPITGELTKWAFHHNQSTMFDSFSHEYGHIMLSMFTWLKDNNYRNTESEESYLSRKNAWDEIKTKFEEEALSTIPKEVDIYHKDIELGVGDGRILLYMRLPEGIEPKAVKNKAVREFAKTMGFKLSMKKDEYQYSRGYTTYTMTLIHQDSSNQPWHYSKVEMDTANHLVLSDGDISKFRTRILNGYSRDKTIINLGKEVEELYKEIYELDEIIPSDVYSGYGYLADTWGNDSDEVNLSEITADVMHERVAEAFSDVVVRGNNANSMSTLLVSAVQYYISALAKGDEESYTDYFRRTFTKEDFGKRIIKHKYIKYRTLSDCR